MSPRPIKKVTPPARAARRAPGWLGACIVGWVAFAIYLPTLRAGFVWDDHFIVTANREIRSLTDLPALLGSHAFSGADAALGSERVVEYYRPVWTASLAVDHALWGLRPFGYHLTNLLLRRGTLWPRARWPLALAALTGGFLILRAVLVHGHPDPHPLAVRMLTAPRLLVESQRIAALPVRLRVFHDIALVTSATPRFWIHLLLLALWVGIALVLRSRASGVFLGMAWALIALLPVSGLVVMLQPALLAERYLYLPTIGIALAVGALIALAERRWRSQRPVLVGIAAVLLVLFGIACMRQGRVWQSDLTLMSAMVEDAPGAVTGHANLGVVLEHEGRLAEARSEYERAVELAPSDHLQHSNLAGVLGKLGHPADAEREFRAALGLKPDDADALYGLGWLDSRAERWEDARKELAASIRVRPGSAASHSALGNVLLNLG